MGDQIFRQHAQKDSLSLEILKFQLDKELSNLLQ